MRKETESKRSTKVVKMAGIVALLSVFALGGCNLFGNGDNVTVDFMLKSAYTSPAASARAVALTEYPVWTTAEVKMTEIVFGYDDGADGFSDTVPVESTINLLTGTATPALPSYNLTPGTYESVYFGAELLDDGSTPSILLEGSWQGTPIRVEFISGEVFEAVAGTLTVNEGDLYPITVLLDPDFWFSSMSDADLEEAVLTDGVIVISDSSNTTLFNAHFAARVDDATQAILPGGTPD
jgi:hypothetical protein